MTLACLPYVEIKFSHASLSLDNPLGQKGKCVEDSNRRVLQLVNHHVDKDLRVLLYRLELHDLFKQSAVLELRNESILQVLCVSLLLQLNFRV